jgi:hypothetical protein
MNKELELRMYGLVPYNISPIQQGIQFGHAVVRYGRLLEKLVEKYPDSEKIKDMKNTYNNWADNHETFIILNGGTTNKNLSQLGSLNQCLEELKKNGIVLSEMYEPDLGDQLTAVVFIVDERVFNVEDYPEFVDHVMDMGDLGVDPRMITYESFNKSDDIYKLEFASDWRDLLGGDNNVFLRGFLKNFRLA